MLRKFYLTTLLLSVLCLLSFDANAVFRVHPKLNDAFSVTAANNLEGHFGDGTMEWEIAANDTASYIGSGQNLLNIVASPNSGELQSEYDFFLGETSSSEASDPTFNVDTFDHDGGDWFRSIQAAQSAFLDTICYDTNDITFLVVFDIGATLADNDYFYLTDQAGASDCTLGIQTRANGDIRVAQGSGTATMFTTLAVGMATTTTDNVLIVSIDMPNSRIDAWYNSDTPVVVTSISFDGTNTTTTSDPATIGGIPFNNALLMPNGYSLKIMGMRATATTDAEAEDAIDHLESRF